MGERTDKQRELLEAAGYVAEPDSDNPRVTRYTMTGWAPRSEQFIEMPLGGGFTCLACGCHVAREFTRKHRERCSS